MPGENLKGAQTAYRHPARMAAQVIRGSLGSPLYFIFFFEGGRDPGLDMYGSEWAQGLAPYADPLFPTVALRMLNLAL